MTEKQEMALPESLVAGRSRRANAGNRMKQLLEQEHQDASAASSGAHPALAFALDSTEADDLFAEVADDAEYEQLHDEVDVVDSDFERGDTDEEGQGGAGGGDDDEEAGERQLEEEERLERKRKRKRAVPLHMRRPAIGQALLGSREKCTATKPKPRSRAQPPPPAVAAAEGNVASATPTSDGEKHISFADDDVEHQGPSLRRPRHASSRSSGQRVSTTRAPSTTTTTVATPLARRGFRKSTTRKKAEVQARLDLEAAQRESRSASRHLSSATRRRGASAAPLTQDQLIAEALETEEANRESLRRFLEREEERRTREGRRNDRRFVGPWIRWRSVGVDVGGPLVTVVDVNGRGDGGDGGRGRVGATHFGSTTAASTTTSSQLAVTADPAVAARAQAQILKRAGVSDGVEKGTAATTPGAAPVASAPAPAPAPPAPAAPAPPAAPPAPAAGAAAPSDEGVAFADGLGTPPAEPLPSAPAQLDCEGDTGRVPSVSAPTTTTTTTTTTEEPKAPATTKVSPPSPLHRETRHFVSLHGLPAAAGSDDEEGGFGWADEFRLLLGDHCAWDVPTVVAGRNRPARPRQSTCVITGLPAVYRDRETGLAYATAEAYATIRKLLRGEFVWTGTGTGLGKRYDGEDAADDDDDGSAPLQGEAGAGRDAGRDHHLRRHGHGARRLERPPPLATGCYLGARDDAGAAGVLREAREQLRVDRGVGVGVGDAAQGGAPSRRGEAVGGGRRGASTVVAPMADGPLRGEAHEEAAGGTVAAATSSTPDVAKTKATTTTKGGDGAAPSNSTTAAASASASAAATVRAKKGGYVYAPAPTIAPGDEAAILAEAKALKSRTRSGR